ncbi:hypothetical protein [Streptomyces sp. NPDC058424]|uniref:hypothetical protein n=1 Tax=Streptomyces sp. NPDC058424 TaxID=3346491 RepID=UPI003668BD68
MTPASSRLRVVVSPEAVGRGLEVLVDIEVSTNNLETLEALEDTLSSYDQTPRRDGERIRTARGDSAAHR